MNDNTLTLSYNTIDGIKIYRLYQKNGNEWSYVTQKLVSQPGSYSFDVPITEAGTHTFAITSVISKTGIDYIAPQDAAFNVNIKYVVDREAYTYQSPITESVGYTACNVCGVCGVYLCEIK